MQNKIKEINECFYYADQESAQRHNPFDAIGYVRTVNGTLEVASGQETEYKYIKSRTELVNDLFDINNIGNINNICENKDKIK